MKRKQFLATMLAASLVTTTIISPIGNVTVRATEIEAPSIETEPTDIEEVSEETEAETEEVSEETKAETEEVSEETEAETEEVSEETEAETEEVSEETEAETEEVSEETEVETEEVSEETKAETEEVSKETEIKTEEVSEVLEAEEDADKDIVITNDENGIPDETLYKAILNQADANGDGQLTKKEAEVVSNILLYYQSGISSLKGIEYCTALKNFTITYSKVSDISPLSGLTNLRYLYLSSNQITDISALSGLTQLEELLLDYNQITDVSALSGLTNLKNLNLGYNRITDVSVLSGLTNLSYLYLNNNQITDISALSDLTNLTLLESGYNQIADVSALSGLTKLENLNLSNNQITDVSTLSGLTNLKNLYLNNNQITDISVLSGLINLSYLNLSDNQLKNVSSLSDLKNLKNLNLYNNQLTEVSGLSGLTNLKTLYLNNNQITDTSALSGLTNLSYLYLNNNQITDISSLSSLTNLYYLDLKNNKITDISPLADVALKYNLDTIYLDGNPIKTYGDFPIYIKYEKEVEVRYLSDADRKRVMEIFGLSEYDGAVICTDGKGVNYSKLNTGSGYGYDYSIFRNEKGELVLSRCYINSEWDDSNYLAGAFHNSYSSSEETKLTVAWEGDTVWVFCHGDATSTDLKFTDKVEKTTQVKPFAKTDSSGIISKAFARDFGLEAVGTLSEEDKNTVFSYFGFDYFGGAISLIPTEGSEYRIDFEKSSYEKGDLSELELTYYTATRNDDGELSIKYNHREWYYFENGKILLSNGKANFLTKGGIGTDIGDCIFTLPAMDKDSDEVGLMHIKVYGPTASWTSHLISYNDKKVLDFYNFTEVKTNDETEEKNESYEVELSEDEQVVSEVVLKALLKENKTKDIVIKSNNNVTFTFAKGTMSAVDGMENYDFGTNIVSNFADAGNMGDSVNKNNFVTRINFNYSGKLPAEASIRFYVGINLAGKQLHYSQILEDGFKHVQTVTVDAEGYITVKQSHCSDYIVTTERLDNSGLDGEDNKPGDANKPSDDTTSGGGNTSNGDNTPSEDKKPSQEESPITGDDGLGLVSSVCALFMTFFVATLMQRRKKNS